MGFLAGLFGGGGAAAGGATAAGATGAAMGGATGAASSSLLGTAAGEASMGAAITNAATSAGNLLPAAQAGAASMSSPMLGAAAPTMTDAIAGAQQGAAQLSIFERGYNGLKETLGDQQLQDQLGAEILKGLGSTRSHSKGPYGTNQSRGYDQTSFNPADNIRQKDPVSIGQMFM